MRIGIACIPQTVTGAPRAMIDRVLELGRRVEALEYSGLWIVDAIGRGRPTMDPLMFLTAVCGETRRIELGTCVMQVPLRHPVELAHRAQTLALLSAGRFRFGIGSGSTKHDFDVVQADYAARFRTLPASLDIMRRVWNGEAVFGPAVSVWPGTEGGPPVLLGAWRSQRWIDLAARQCQGWIASGIYSAWEDLATGVRMYRDAGGKRAVLANVFADLRPEAARPGYGAAKVTLVGTKAEALERLRRLADIGFDDILLIPPFDALDQLDSLRDLASSFS